MTALTPLGSSTAHADSHRPVIRSGPTAAHRRGPLVRIPARGCSLLLIVLAGLLGPALASAHSVAYPISADSLTISTGPNPSTWTFSFSASNEVSLSLAHDPSLEGFNLLVSGAGANAGRSYMITLDPTAWSYSAMTSQWTYSDPTGARGGITDVVIGDGAVSIQGSGENWPWEITGGQDEIWVQFWNEDENYCANFSTSTSASFSFNQQGLISASGASAPGACPSPFCGNNLVEVGESCDDGNASETDGCTTTCEIGECDAPEYDSTWEAIQELVLEPYNCLICHGPIPLSNTLALYPEVAHDNLVGQVSSSTTSGDLLVQPGDPNTSLLYKKLANRTLGLPLAGDEGSGMPLSLGVPLTEDHLSAVKEWIYAAAPETGVVEAATQYLGACLPLATPHKIPVPDPPPAGEGIQLQQTKWPLYGLATDPNGEDEICMATYYDLTAGDIVPEEYQTACPDEFGVNNPSDTCFRWHDQTLYQDPTSHHSIIHIYSGDYDVNFPGTAQNPLQSFGPFTYKDGPNVGQSCDPKAVDSFTGINANCSGRVVSTLACISIPPFTQFGPPDYVANFNSSGFAGSQEAFSERLLADGVYGELPMQGVVIWNSHAFNTTQFDTTMEQYLNISFAGLEDQVYPFEQIFDLTYIFDQNVPPYGTQELCQTFTLPINSHLFNLNSHTHRFGVGWRTWLPPNPPCDPSSASTSNCPPRTDQPDYSSTVYTDPVDKEFYPPKFYNDPDPASRTLLFCSEYDNGSTPDSPSVKRASTSPVPPGPFALAGLGGPCGNDTIACYGGSNAGQLCNGNDSVCDSGVCDACPVLGGVTTEDEMFILLGRYYVSSVPEPSAGALMFFGLSSMIYLARRRRNQGV